MAIASNFKQGKKDLRFYRKFRDLSVILYEACSDKIDSDDSASINSKYGKRALSRIQIPNETPLSTYEPACVAEKLRLAFI